MARNQRDGVGEDIKPRSVYNTRFRVSQFWVTFGQLTVRTGFGFVLYVYNMCEPCMCVLAKRTLWWIRVWGKARGESLLKMDSCRWYWVRPNTSALDEIVVWQTGSTKHSFDEQLMNIFSFEVDHFLRGVDIGLFSRTLRKTGRGTSREKK